MTSRNIHLTILFWALIAGSISPAEADTVQPDRVPVTLHLKRGDFTFNRYVPGDTKFAAHPQAVIIFGSGDGGITPWEDRLSRALQAAGYEVLEVDCALYAKTDYDLDTLQADTNTIAQSSRVHYGGHPPPLILGGWSMGANQAVPAAGGPHPPAGLVGLLLVSPSERGRYGLRTPDRWDVLPTGPGTFALEDFAHSLDKVRVVQWGATLDLFSSTKWLSSLTAPHKALNYTNGTHFYNPVSEAWWDGPSESFIKLLEASVTWILTSDGPASRPGAIKKD